MAGGGWRLTPNEGGRKLAAGKATYRSSAHRNSFGTSPLIPFTKWDNPLLPSTIPHSLTDAHRLHSPHCRSHHSPTAVNHRRKPPLHSCDYRHFILRFTASRIDVWKSFNKAGRGRVVRRAIIPHVLTPNPPIPPFQAPLEPQSSPLESESPVETPIEPQAPVENEFNTDLSIQQRGPRGAYLAKNIPKDASKRQLIHIFDEHYLEPIATGTITKDFKAYFRGKQTEWHLIDKELKDNLYKSFQDRFQYEETVDPEIARKVWEARSKARCRGTWALARRTCKLKSKSTNPSDWKEYCPDFVKIEDWGGILDSWKTDKWQTRSIVGAANRKSVPGDMEGTSSYVRHTGGSISFGVHRYRMEQILGEKPSEIMMFEKMHKTHKGNGDGCDARSEQVSTKYVEVVYVADDDDLESDLPFDTDAWVKVVGVPKKDDVYGFGRTQVAKRIHIQSSSSHKKRSTLYDSTPVDNEVVIESQVNERVESRLQSIREEMREERRIEMEQFMKSFNEQHNKSS